MDKLTKGSVIKLIKKDITYYTEVKVISDSDHKTLYGFICTDNRYRDIISHSALEKRIEEGTALTTINI